MRVLFKKILLYFLIIFYAQHSFSANSCQDFFQGLLIDDLKRIGVSGLTQPYNQCFGTCYAYATLKGLNYILRNKTKSTVEISHIYLLKELLKDRLKNNIFNKTPMQLREEFDFSFDYKTNKLNFISGGTEFEIRKILNQKSVELTIFNKKILLEDKVDLESDFNKIFDEIFDMVIDVEASSPSSGLLLQPNARLKRAINNFELYYTESGLNLKLNIPEFKFVGKNEKDLDYQTRNFFSKTADAIMVKNFIKESLIEERPLLLTSLWSDRLKAVDKKQNKVFLTTKNSKLFLDVENIKSIGLHLILVTGAHLNKDGSVRYLEVQDSNGDNKFSPQGTYLVTMDFFYKYAQRLTALDLEVSK